MARYNFEGWEFTEWVKGNERTIKEVFKVGFPFLVSTFIVDTVLANFLLTVVGKFVLDCLEYYINK